MEITIEEFINKINTMNREDAERYMETFVKNEYVPYEKKVTYGKMIAEKCSYKKDLSNSKTDYARLYIDSTLRYMLSCMMYVMLYTSIKCDNNDTDMLYRFNELNKMRLFDVIMKNIDQSEMKEINMVINLCFDDLMANEYELHSFITKQVTRFVDLMKELTPVIMQNVDTDAIKGVLNEVVRVEQEEV